MEKFEYSLISRYIHCYANIKYEILSTYCEVCSQLMLAKCKLLKMKLSCSMKRCHLYDHGFTTQVW